MYIRLNNGPNMNLLDVFKLVGTGLSPVCCFVIRGSTDVFFSVRISSGVVLQPKDLHVSQCIVSVESLSLTHHRLIRDLFVFYVDSLMG